MEEKKLKINFKDLAEKKMDFDPKEIIEQKNEAMPVPEMMKKDLKKMQSMLGKRKIGELK